MQINKVGSSLPISGPAAIEKESQSTQTSSQSNQQANLNKAIEQTYSNFDQVISAVTGSGTSTSTSNLQELQGNSSKTSEIAESIRLQQSMDANSKTEQEIGNAMKAAADTTDLLTRNLK